METELLHFYKFQNMSGIHSSILLHLKCSELVYYSFEHPMTFLQVGPCGLLSGKNAWKDTQIWANDRIIFSTSVAAGN